MKRKEARNCLLGGTCCIKIINFIKVLQVIKTVAKRVKVNQKKKKKKKFTSPTKHMAKFKTLKYPMHSEKQLPR